MVAAHPLLDIASLAKTAGVSSRTIRYYGELGLLPAEERGPGRRRLYGPDARKRLAFIARLKSLGLTLDEIGELNTTFDEGRTPAMLERLDSLLDHHLAALTSRMNELKGLENELASYRDRIQRRIEKDSSR
jgi:DNA-binding transcriptional MerR regulator